MHECRVCQGWFCSQCDSASDPLAGGGTDGGCASCGKFTCTGCEKSACCAFGSYVIAARDALQKRFGVDAAPDHHALSIEAHAAYRQDLEEKRMELGASLVSATLGEYDLVREVFGASILFAFPFVLEDILEDLLFFDVFPQGH